MHNCVSDGDLDEFVIPGNRDVVVRRLATKKSACGQADLAFHIKL